MERYEFNARRRLPCYVLTKNGYTKSRSDVLDSSSCAVNLLDNVGFDPRA